MHRCGWFTVLCTATLSASLVPVFARGQESPPPSSAPAAQNSAAPPAKSGKKKYSHANDFLIRGTVFNERALSFPGVQLRVRRVGEKKFRWESYTNSRGEFALRVPQGSDYELVVHCKGFPEQKRTIEAKNGDNEESLVFRMQPAAGDKQ